MNEEHYPEWLKKDLEHFRFEYSMGDLSGSDLGIIEGWAQMLAPSIQTELTELDVMCHECNQIFLKCEHGYRTA